MEYSAKTPKKLIEVALPLEAINTESLRRKQKAPKGWPTSFHKWWAQRPLAAARAVLFGQMVNDPSWRWELEHPEEIPPNNLKATWAASRKRLFGIIENLVLWDNSNNEAILAKAHEEIRKSWHETCEINRDHPQASVLFDPESFPAIYDPFVGSGTIALEAQRLGLKTYASDLNPVAVLINKALIEIPRKFSGLKPVNSAFRAKQDLIERKFNGAQGLAEDVRYYGDWMRNEAQNRLGHLYPSIEVTREMTTKRSDLKPLVGHKLTAIAWIWARTVKSPNPAFRHIDVPLASTFMLSSKEGKEAYVHPVVSGDQYHFTVAIGKPTKEAKDGTKLGRGSNFRCVMSNVAIDADYIKAEGKAGRMGQKLLAIVADGERGRVYLPPTTDAEVVARKARPEWKPEVTISGSTQYLGVKPYGMDRFDQLFTHRQLVALTNFADLIPKAAALAKRDALNAKMTDNGQGLAADGNGATAYSEAIAVYLACVLDRMIYYGSTLTTWLPKDNALRDCMPRQALAMTWDFAEGNPLGKSSGDVRTCIGSIANYLDVAAPRATAVVRQCDARSIDEGTRRFVFCTDPPYYDNVPYADLSDYFYVWLRRSLKPIYPDLFATLAVPKAEELVAFAYRHEKGKAGAEKFFLDGMTDAMHRLAERAHPAFPVTIYYAFKQAETDEESGTVSSGWETFLMAVIRAGFAITGTLPMRTEGEGRMRASDSNALASSIVLVCWPRSVDAPSVSRRAFLRELNMVLPEALDEMTKGAGGDRSPVAPVDLSQAIIGPGMAVFSKYSAVLEADGTPMSVKTALQLINRFLAEDDFDHDTQFCLHWFEQHGWGDGKFGDADTLARAKGTAVEGVKQTGVLFASGGVVRLLKWADYPDEWNPETDTRLPVWEALHQLIRVFKTDGESGAGKVLGAIQDKGEAVRQLGYRLHTLCERAGWAEDARAYNEIITSWSAIESAATAAPKLKQGSLFAEGMRKP